MDIAEIRALYQTEHFVPFEILLRGGRIILVMTHDHVWVTPGGTVHVVDSDRQHLIFDRTRIEAIKHREEFA